MDSITAFDTRSKSHKNETYPQGPLAIEQQLKLAHVSFLTVLFVHVVMVVVYAMWVLRYNSFGIAAEGTIAFLIAGAYACFYALCGITLLTAHSSFPVHWVSVFAAFESFALGFVAAIQDSALPYILASCLAGWFVIGSLFLRAPIKESQDPNVLFPQHLLMIQLFSVAFFAMASVAFFQEKETPLHRVVASASMFGVLLLSNAHKSLYYYQRHCVASRIATANIVMFFVSFVALFGIAASQEVAQISGTFWAFFLVFWVDVVVMCAVSMYKVCNDSEQPDQPLEVGVGATTASVDV